MSKFDKFLVENDKINQELTERIESIVEENSELFEDVEAVQKALGGFGVVTSSAINRFARGAKSDAEIVMLLFQNKDSFPEKAKTAIASLFKKYEPQIQKLKQQREMSSKVKEAGSAPRQYDDIWGRKMAK